MSHIDGNNPRVGSTLLCMPPLLKQKAPSVKCVCSARTVRPFVGGCALAATKSGRSKESMPNRLGSLLPHVRGTTRQAFDPKSIAGRARHCPPSLCHPTLTVASPLLTSAPITLPLPPSMVATPLSMATKWSSSLRLPLSLHKLLRRLL